MDYCGSQRPPEFNSLGNTVSVTFAADAQTQSRGFKLEFSIASKPGVGL